MKIAMIQPPILGRGGGERQLLRLAVELQKRGNTVEVFTPALNTENSYPDMIRQLNVTVIGHPLGRKIPRWLTPMDAAEKAIAVAKGVPVKKSALREYMRRSIGKQIYTYPYEIPAMLNLGRKIPKCFDVINNHNYPSEWAAVYAKKRLGAPVVWMCNEPPFWFFVPELRKGLRKVNWPVYNLLDKTAVDYVDEILVLSHIAGGYVRKAYNRSSRVVRSGIDADQFVKASGAKIREKYGLSKDFVLLQVGNLELNKRQADCIEALAILSKKHDNLKLVFDGGGRRDDLMQLSRKLGLEEKVLFLHSMGDEALAEVYAACDVFLFPAQITWGLAVVEAMAAAKPVVVSNKCGASEIIKHNKNGLVIEHANPQDLASKVEALMNDADRRRRLGENAQVYVKCNLSWAKFAESMEKIFEQEAKAYQK
jgi:glycosyltransferase involved in cell wall biosynthesis